MTPEEIAKKIVTALFGSEPSHDADEAMTFVEKEIRLYAEAREQAAAVTMREKCANAETSPIHSVTIPTLFLDRAVLVARLEEAEWWRSHINSGCQCIRCRGYRNRKRIADIKSKLQKLEAIQLK